MTTTSVDWENTETKTSVSAGKRKLKMWSVSRSTTTMTKCKHKCKTVMFVRNRVFRNGVFYNNARSYFLSRTSNFIDDEEFFVLSHLFLTFSSGKTPAFRTKIIRFQPERDDRIRVSVRDKIWKKRHSDVIAASIESLFSLY